MNLKHATCTVRLKSKDDATGITEQIVSVYGNRDSYNECMVFGCFAESLAAKLPKGVWMHDWKQPVAKTLEAKECAPGDPLLPPDLQQLGGLYIKAQFNLGTQRGKEAYSDLSFGTVDEFSIGYTVDAYEFDNEEELTRLTKVILYEWSPVLVGANPATALLSVKDFAGGWPNGLTPDKQVELLLAGAEDLKARFKQFEEDRPNGISPERIAKVKQLGEGLIGFALSCKRASAADGPAHSKVDESRLLEAQVLEMDARFAGVL